MRKYAVLSIFTVLALGAVGVFASFQEWWILSVVLGYCTFLVIAVLVVIATRYLARLLRTLEGKTRIANKRFKEQVDEGERQREAVLEGQRQFIFEGQQNLFELCQKEFSSQSDHIASLDTKIHSQSDHIASLDTKIHRTARTTMNHVSSTVQHGTSEIEALLQIFSRYSQLKLPMPNTGGWALDARSLAHLISIVEDQRPQQILELGSGTSTIWLGYLCRSYGGKLITLDHLESYLDETRAEITKHGLDDYVECRLAPLEDVSCDGEKYSWYAPSAISDLSDIDLLLVDGPPAKTGPRARYPALANTVDLLTSDATVVLDDAHRSDEVEVVSQWLALYPEFTPVTVGTPRLAVLQREC